MPAIDDSARQAMRQAMARRPAVANGSAPTATARTEGEGRSRLDGACTLAIDRLVPDPDQPRRTFEEGPLRELAASIRDRGQLVPIIVRWNAEAGHYAVIDGERRYRAAILAGVATMACVAVKDSDPATVLEIQLMVNALREDVSPVEQARAWQRLMDAKGYTQAQLAERLHYTPGTVGRTVALLKLPDEALALVESEQLDPSVAREFARIDDAEVQAELATRAVEEQWTREIAIEEAQQAKARARRTKPGKAAGRPAKVSAAKGRGASPDRRKEWRHATATGLRLTVTASRNVDLLELAEALIAWGIKARGQGIDAVEVADEAA